MIYKTMAEGATERAQAFLGRLDLYEWQGRPSKWLHDLGLKALRYLEWSYWLRHPMDPAPIGIECAHTPRKDKAKSTS